MSTFKYRIGKFVFNPVGPGETLNIVEERRGTSGCVFQIELAGYENRERMRWGINENYSNPEGILPSQRSLQSLLGAGVHRYPKRLRKPILGIKNANVRCKPKCF